MIANDTPQGYLEGMGTAARRSRNQSRHHTAHWAKAQEGTLTYVALGDSAAVGVGVDDPEQSYVGVVAGRLAVRTGEAIRVVNLAVSGAKARDVLHSQIPKLAAMPAPDVVTCVIGGNDVARSGAFRADEFALDVQAIAARLPEGSVMGLVPNFMHWPYEGRARKANRAIREAASVRGHGVADIHAATKELSLRAYMRTFADDCFHPNSTGHTLWADAIWDQLAQNQLTGS